MLFNSVGFLVFYVVVLAVYFSLPPRFHWAFLLAASYYFYMCWRAEYVVLIAIATLTNYFVGLQLGKTEDKFKRAVYLAVGLTVSLGILFAFKYWNFFGDAVQEALRSVNVLVDVPHVNWLLPVGISFYTFQALSYTIDVYRRKVPVERHLGIFALYVSFFPQLVAGPIERPQHLLPQFKSPRVVTAAKMRSGFEIAMWGLFKKVVVADLLARVVDHVYEAPQQYCGPMLLLATFFFAIQIYCDFSGYSDIAIGIARILGFELMTNFRQPYLSQSIREFWQRWHISLCTWFRDYLYIPLGGNRVSRLRWYCNIMIVFVVSGLWHGASWTFLVWGALHGFYLVFALATAPWRSRIAHRLGVDQWPRLLSIWRTVVVFSLVLLGWIFFRAQSLSDAVHIVTRLFSDMGEFRVADLFMMGLPRFEAVLAFAVVSVVFLVDWLVWSESAVVKRLWQMRPLRWACCYACLYSIVFFGVFDEVEFIYFQF